MIHVFGNPKLIGNKASKLLELSNNGFNVPAAIVITSDHLASTANSNVFGADEFYFLQRLLTNRNNLFSVRSSPIVSMPGMMDTILNLGIDYKKINTEFYESLYRKYDSGYKDLPPLEQFKKALTDVIGSFNSPRAKLFRKIKNIPEILPAVIVQEMVFGNLNEQSGTGLLFTRNNNGDPTPVIEYITNKQGIDIVDNNIDQTEFVSPPKDINQKLISDSLILEQLFKYPQEVEFTVQNNELFYLQTRNLMFNNLIDLKIITDLSKKFIIFNEEKDERVDAWFKLNQLSILDYSDNQEYLFDTVIVASSGICQGIGTSDLDKLDKTKILIKFKVTNDDLPFLSNCCGVITSEGALTAHSSIICRTLGIPYIIIPEIDMDTLIDIPLTIDGYSGKLLRTSPDIKLVKITKENYNEYV